MGFFTGPVSSSDFMLYIIWLILIIAIISLIAYYYDINKNKDHVIDNYDYFFIIFLVLLIIILVLYCIC